MWLPALRPRSSVAALAALCVGLPMLLPPPALAQKAPSTAGAASVRYDIGNEIFHPVLGRNGMVASEHRLATEIGVDILKRGGNAVDAAVAVGFALAVVLPNAGNVGGGGFMIVHDAKSGKDVAIDFREMAPAKAFRDMYLDEQGKVVPDRSLYTHLAVGIPGTVAGLAHALEKYGTMPLADVLAPAIRLARDGHTVTPQLAGLLEVERDHLAKWDATKAIFFKDGRPLTAGETLANPDLANSLEMIAQQGPKAFYEGPIADRIAAEMAQHGGYLTKEDLKAYKVVEREPVAGSYRGYTVKSMPPPSSGGTHIIQMLNILERWPLKDYGPDSAQAIHLMAEAMKLAYADRSEYLGDPDFTKVPVKGLTSRKYADELAARIDPEKATPAAAIKPGNPAPYESDQTTHFSVADAQGNVVSTTYTLNLNFGSGIVAAGTGILLNNEMDDFSAKPGVPNAFGLIGGDANAVQPYKRPLSSMSPTIVLKDGKPWLVTGSPGGSRIITTTMETVVDHIDFGMNPAEAAALPRVHHQWTPDELRVEKGLSPDTVRLLERMGHKVSVKATMGRTQTIQMTDEGMSGYSDPRNPDGMTIGY
ncbi:gamma-glutamyltransferase [Azospirillum picis]|uniref:Glutathione hydrolase proenzyme n=1 Tax=Azospirillum picis TaxID=488438 RepID=A0ABU0MDW0_9PROT|nr:gamma-glutamyltransferase [Azospirillum picis]MBP2297526.1 gamma-glutamyltranspeptidase/glutathione hydrolase [Azospirillum picis]MDQ0531451.1 gamma-glutamyltranspeptidase/glutathione hydrolase [Azospirillum picis]